MSELKTSEVLDLAADKIQEHGWIQGTEGWDGEEGSRLCLEGGILAALGRKVFTGNAEERITMLELQMCPAYRAVQSYLDFRVPLYQWNDLSASSKEEVVEVLRAAAAVERAKEESLEGAEVTA